MARITAAAKERVRRALIESAASHFAQHGLERANINTIAVEAGFAKGTVYNYFVSKEELFGEVLAEACRRAVRRYSGLEHGESVRERLAALVRADVTVLREEEAFMKVLLREAMSFRGETYPIVVENLAPFLTLVEDIVVEGVRTKEVRADRPVSQLALLFVGILALLFVQHWGSAGVWPTLEELPELAVTAFLDGAAPRRASPGATAKR
jgi:AcrR family transcriptional regulator